MNYRTYIIIKILFISFFIILINTLKAQRDTITGQIYDFPKEDLIKYSYDSLGRKQGDWIEKKNNFIVIYSDKDSFLLNTYKETGFYKDNKKDGTWEIWSINKDEDIEKLVAFSYYKSDTLMYTLYVKNKKVRVMKIYTPLLYDNNDDSISDKNLCEIIYFDKRGKIKKRKHFFLHSENYNNQHLHYLPYGELFIDQRASSYNARYKFNAKELDNETGFYYYGARYMMPEWSFWLSVDTKSDKYPHQSNYMFCSGNPIILIDPNGEVEWEINNKGDIIKHTQTSKHDAFILVDNNGNRIEGKKLILKYGTIEKQQTNTYIDNNNINSYDIYRVRGDENGKILFEFFSNNTNVEFSQAKLGQKGDKGLNYITTSHLESKEYGMPRLINKQLKFGYYAREFNHNHPSNTNYPSGSFNYTDKDGKYHKTGKWGDVYFANKTSTIFGNHVKYNIYTPNNKQYIEFDKKSIKQNYGKSFNKNNILKNLLLNNYMSTDKYEYLIIDEYIFKDSTLYNELCNIVFADSVFKNNHKSEYLSLAVYDTLIFLFNPTDGNMVKCNLRIGHSDEIDYNEILGYLKLDNNICFFYKSISANFVSNNLLKTKQSKKFKYFKQIKTPDDIFNGIVIGGPIREYVMILNENNKIEVVTTLQYE